MVPLLLDPSSYIKKYILPVSQIHFKIMLSLEESKNDFKYDESLLSMIS